MSEPGAKTPIDDVVTRLAERFPGVARDRIEQVVAAELRTFDGARVTDFVPVLVEHQVRDALHREARSSG